MTDTAGLQTDETPEVLVLTLTGTLDIHGVASIWKPATQAVEKTEAPTVRLRMDGVTGLDLSGAAFVCHLTSAERTDGKGGEILGLKPELLSLVTLARDRAEAEVPLPAPLSFTERTGQELSETLNDARTFVSFIGEITWALGAALCRPAGVRWQDTFKVAEQAGVNALPIALLISFIVGLVMAFQAAIPMKTFGAEIYVANLIGIAMVRELGPLMTAIVLAGRSASAFAAEIGTMKINEEIDALTVMGINPVRFLILPRIIATTFITPLLTVFSNLIGIIGGAVVILSFGYPLITYYHQVVGFVSWGDLLGGLVKCVVFGLIIAATGCIRGYQTRQGPSAVGEATTRAVVSSIILIAVFDGFFSVVYYYLGI